MGAVDLSTLTDDQLEILEANLEKRTSYERFCEDTELFPGEAPAKHHRLICEALQQVLDRKITRLMIFAGPGTAKSSYVSKRFIAYAVAYRQGIKIINASHTKALAAKHGRESRNYVMQPGYRVIWPECAVSADQQARDDWATTAGSEVFSIGLDGAAAGRRADILAIDDPFTGRIQADSPTERESRWNIYNADLRGRLRKGGAIILMHTRWHDDDIAGRLLPEEYDGESGWIEDRFGELWLVLNLQMECKHPECDLLGRQYDELLWPEWFPAAKIAQEKKSIGMREYNAQYQGIPKDKKGGVLPAALWRKWPSDTPPVVEYVVQSYDTAFSEGEENDFSARTTWGVFDIYNDANADVLSALWKATGNKEVQRYHAVLLERLNVRVAFPELKKMAVDGFETFKPDRVLIENKASGQSLIQELRRGRIPVKAVNPNKTGSKTTRGHVASVCFEQGCVWYMDRDWAREVINQCAKFPAGKHDDLYDTVTQTLIWLRRTYHLQFKGENDGED